MTSKDPKSSVVSYAQLCLRGECQSVPQLSSQNAADTQPRFFIGRVCPPWLLHDN